MKQPDFSYRINGMFALILPESRAGEAAMGELGELTNGTFKVLSSHVKALRSDLRRAGYSLVKRSARKTCSKADIEHLFGAISH